RQGEPVSEPGGAIAVTLPLSMAMSARKRSPVIPVGGATASAVGRVALARTKASASGGGSMSVLAPHGALVPAPEQQPGDEIGGEVDRDAGRRQEDQRRVHARRVGPELRFEESEGEPRAASGRTGGEFRH